MSQSVLPITTLHPLPGNPPGLLSERAVHSLLELAPDGIFVANIEGRYTYVNAAGCEMLGYSRDELVGLTILDFIPAEDVNRLMRSKAKMMTGGSDPGEWLLRRKDGTWLPVEVNANILPDGQWQGFVRDISARKADQAEKNALFEKLDRKERWVDAVMDQMPLGVVLFEVGGRITFNQRAEQIVGMKLLPDRGIQQYAACIRRPDGSPVALEELPSRRVLGGGAAVYAEEYLVRRPDGSEIPMLASAAPIFDGEGRLYGAVGVFQDMTDLMRMQRAVRENERLLKAVFDILPVGVWIADKSGRIISNNPAAKSIWGGGRHVSIDEYGLYKGWWLDTGKPIAAQDWGMARALTKGENSTGELIRIQCFDGTAKTIIHSAAALRDEHGQITGAIVVNEDITALHEAQEKQAASEQLLRTVIELLPVGLWVADGQGNILLTNPAAKRIWGGSPHVGPKDYGQYEGRWADTGSPVAPDEWGLARAIGRGETSRRELIRIKCFDGAFKTIINWAAPIRGTSGEITGAVAVNEDVTVLHQTQEQLRAAVRDREHLLAVVAHDLRSPLNGIGLSAAMLDRMAESGAAADKLKDAAASIARMTGAMAGLVDDLLAVSVAEPGRSMMDFAPVAAARVIAQAVEAAAPQIAEAGLDLIVMPMVELPEVHIDLNRILRVFANLFDNGMKFTERGGRILVQAESLQGVVRVCISNSGPPLGEQERKRLFQPFWQAGREDRRGAGLGLSICRSIIEAHGGSIWADAAEGMCVKICLTLPCVRPARP